MLSTGHKHQIFLDNTIIGAGYRNNAVCPICYSKDKDRLVYYYLKIKKMFCILHQKGNLEEG